MLRKILLGIELLLGLILLVCILFNNKTGSASAVIGIDLNIKNGTIIAGIFYFIRETINFIIVHSDAMTPPFIQSFLMILEMITGIFMALSGYAQDKAIFIESSLNIDLTINYGIAALGLLFIFKSLNKFVLADTNMDIND